MARYIDVDKTLKKLPDDLPYKASVKRVLMQAPEADVAEVRHGEWLLDGRCSECLANPLTTHRTYCPSCGAKMDKNELLENPEQLDLRPISCGAKMYKGVMA